jgi:hypothetical protein
MMPWTHIICPCAYLALPTHLSGAIFNGLPGRADTVYLNRRLDAEPHVLAPI